VSGFIGRDTEKWRGMVAGTSWREEIAGGSDGKKWQAKLGGKALIVKVTFKVYNHHQGVGIFILMKYDQSVLGNLVNWNNSKQSIIANYARLGSDLAAAS
jgi:hypothetical protein